jgi:purine-binding chemotaxis protein CheW
MPAATGNEQFLVFKAAGQSLALPTCDVAEIIRPRAMTRVPHGPASLLGLINFRSAALPVVSLANLLGGENVPSTGSARVVVVDRGMPLGLLVDEISALNDAGNERRIDLETLLARDFSKLVRKTSAQRVSTIAPSTASSSPERNRDAFICFHVGGQDYALPLDQVVEVSPFPTDLAHVPHTDEAMVGVTALRSGLVPLVSLRVLLGLPTDGFDRTRARIVLVRFGGRVVGLITDGIKTILRVDRETLDPVPPVLTRGAGEAQIQAICRLDGGRLVSVLALDKLFDAQTSARILADAAHGAAEMVAADTQGDSEQFIIFQLGDEHYGLPIASIDEVVRRPDSLTRVPRAPPFVEGVMSLRGKMVPIIDQRKRFAVRGEADIRGRRVVVVTVDGLQTGIVVDKVSEILAIPASELKSAPELETETTPVFDRIAMIERDGRIILLVDPKALLDRAERDILGALGNEAADAPSS